MSGTQHQLSLSYSSEEDRLLLIITTREQQEYRVWLSRRYTGMLLGVIRNIINELDGNGAQAAEHKQHAPGTPGIPPEHGEAGQSASDHGMLAYGIKTEQIDDGQFSMELFSKDQQKINFVFDRPNILLFDEMLHQGLIKTDWNICEMTPIRTQVH